MLVLLLTGCISAPSDHPAVVFDSMWSEFDAMYGGFHQRDIDWDAAYDTWSPEVDSDSTDDELYDAIGGLMTELDDGHVRLFAPDRPAFESNKVYREELMTGTFDDQVVRTYLTNPDTGPWDWYLEGELAPDVAYIWFPGIDDNTWMFEDLTARNPDSIVIDLRHSHGGATNFTLRGLKPLFAEDTPMYRTRSRDGAGRDDYDAWFTWTQAGAEGAWDGDIYMLVDAETISASERVALTLQLLPNVTTIGVPTNGSFATSIVRELPNGWGYQLPVQEFEAIDGSVPEGKGLTVDIEMLNDPDDVAAGKDEVLEYTLGLATAGR